MLQILLNKSHIQLHVIAVNVDTVAEMCFKPGQNITIHYADYKKFSWSYFETL